MNTLRIALFLAFKSITRGNRVTIALMIFILSLAFINLVFLSSILNGVTVALNKQLKTNLVSNIVIDPQEEPTRKSFIIHAKELQRQIENIPGVVATARRYRLAGAIAYDKDRNGKFKIVSGEVIGIEPEQEKRVTDIANKIVDGCYLEGLGRGEIVLGSDLAGGYDGSELTSLGGAKVGDRVKVTFSNGIIRSYKVRGIFQVKLGFVDRLAFITVKEAESMISRYDNASQVLVKTEETDSEGDYAKKIQTLAPNLKVRKWIDYAGALANISRSFDIITFVISAIGLAVAGITIFILIYVNVVNKRRQIGVLKAIGIKQNIIVYSYILQALFYAVSGVIIGLLLILYVIAPFFVAHPLRLPIGDTSLALDRTTVVYGILGLLAAAVVAGLIPSRQAARQNILKAIWGA